VIILLLLWEIVSGTTGIPQILLPPPSEVLLALSRGLFFGERELIGYTVFSLQVLLTAALIGVTVAMLFTTLAILTRFGRDLLETLTSMFNPLPAIALLPVALLWFGLGVQSVIFVVIHSVLWPMTLNTYTGFSTVPRTLVRVGRNFGLKGWRLVKEILIPAALPSIFTGIKVGWAFAWRTVIAAELVFGVAGAGGGLGWYINIKRYYLETAEMFAGLLMVILIGLLVENVLFKWIEQRTIRRWGMAIEHH
jgi:NitT/TauT family transport system permease protein